MKTIETGSHFPYKWPKTSSAFSKAFSNRIWMTLPRSTCVCTTIWDTISSSACKRKNDVPVLIWIKQIFENRCCQSILSQTHLKSESPAGRTVSGGAWGSAERTDRIIWYPMCRESEREGGPVGDKTPAPDKRLSGHTEFRPESTEDKEGHQNRQRVRGDLRPDDAVHPHDGI